MLNAEVPLLRVRKLPTPSSSLANPLVPKSALINALWIWNVSLNVIDNGLTVAQLPI
jgi:hypothetical protein